MQDLVLAYVNLGSLSSKQNELKISISFRYCPSLKNQVHLLILKKLKERCYLKEILILNSFCFEDKDPRFTRLKPGLSLRLLTFKRTILYRGMVLSGLYQTSSCSFNRDLRVFSISILSGKKCEKHKPSRSEKLR